MLHTKKKLSGDIQPDPGPVKHPCVICERPVAKNHHIALQCDSCGTHPLRGDNKRGI